MDANQLALFPDTAVTGSGQPKPWPAVETMPEPKTPAVDPNQFAFDDEDGEAAA
ncbi:hypothetical protein [Streptomyces sp. 351MFTsu5.1]|uniref:hypothetical protein n=1 Tax=Streptomyces sp. 351MFTsu5.1 TaxID=1172180 RepID=UPI000369D7D1|nr:hypothetical protein [Streptomyces sp. 351MFTsu5.1]